MSRGHNALRVTRLSSVCIVDSTVDKILSAEIMLYSVTYLWEIVWLAWLNCVNSGKYLIEVNRGTDYELIVLSGPDNEEDSRILNRTGIDPVVSEWNQICAFSFYRVIVLNCKEFRMYFRQPRLIIGPRFHSNREQQCEVYSTAVCGQLGQG